MVDSIAARLREIDAALVDEAPHVQEQRIRLRALAVEVEAREAEDVSPEQIKAIADPIAAVVLVLAFFWFLWKMFKEGA